MTNDLNRPLLAKLIELKILDPAPLSELKLRGLERVGVTLLHGDPEPEPKSGHRDAPPEKSGDADAPPKV